MLTISYFDHPFYFIVANCYWIAYVSCFLTHFVIGLLLLPFRLLRASPRVWSFSIPPDRPIMLPFRWPPGAHTMVWLDPRAGVTAWDSCEVWNGHSSGFISIWFKFEVQLLHSFYLYQFLHFLPQDTWCFEGGTAKRHANLSNPGYYFQSLMREALLVLSRTNQSKMWHEMIIIGRHSRLWSIETPSSNHSLKKKTWCSKLQDWLRLIIDHFRPEISNCSTVWHLYDLNYPDGRDLFCSTSSYRNNHENLCVRLNKGVAGRRWNNTRPWI